MKTIFRTPDADAPSIKRCVAEMLVSMTLDGVDSELLYFSAAKWYTTSHPAVATLISSLRRMDGVVRVSLDSSQKGNETDSSSSTGDCRGGTSDRTQFTLTIFLEAPVAATAPAPAATSSASSGGTPSSGATGASQ